MESPGIGAFLLHEYLLMIELILQMAAIIASGLLWRVTTPGGVSGDQLRQSLTTLVYYFLLPALVLLVLWEAPLNLSVLVVSLLAAMGVLLGIVLTWSSCRMCHMPAPVMGAAILAASFPNATYMGLPVLENLFGDFGRSVAIQYDLFACTPILLTAGVLLSERFGNKNKRTSVFKTLLNVPPLWAAALAVALNGFDVPMPNFLSGWLGMLSVAVVPLMLFSLGLGLRWAGWQWSYLPVLLPIILIQLFLMPLWVAFLGGFFDLDARLFQAVVLEAAMPSMVLGIVFCDRYGLHTGVYALAVTITTAFSLITLPLWFSWLTL